MSFDAERLPDEIRAKLAELDLELSEGDITQKGYEKKKSRLLEPYITTAAVAAENGAPPSAGTFQVACSSCLTSVVDVLTPVFGDGFHKSFCAPSSSTSPSLFVGPDGHNYVNSSAVANSSCSAHHGSGNSSRSSQAHRDYVNQPAAAAASAAHHHHHHHHGGSSSGQKHSSSGGGNGGGGGNQRGERRTQKKITHNEKRYHSGKVGTFRSRAIEKPFFLHAPLFS